RYSVACFTTARLLPERLLEVGPERLDVLEPDRQAEQPGRDPVALPAVPALHRRRLAAEARRVEDQLRARLDGAWVRDVERDHAGEAGVAHAPDRPLFLQAAGEFGRARGDATHPFVERVETAEE